MTIRSGDSRHIEVILTGCAYERILEMLNDPRILRSVSGPQSWRNQNLGQQPIAGSELTLELLNLRAAGTDIIRAHS